MSALLTDEAQRAVCNRQKSYVGAVTGAKWLVDYHRTEGRSALVAEVARVIAETNDRPTLPGRYIADAEAVVTALVGEALPFHREDRRG